MIEAYELTKRYGDTTAVHSLSFTIAPSTVTGFLGPNGAGKSTTMRMIMGLDRPTSGTVTVNGKPYRQHRAPLREVGALLDAKAVHPGRSARSHLRTLAATHNIKASRVSEVIEMTGLAEVATKRVGGFSLGMGQRLGIAAALLGDPRTLILDEPVNGLDPEGVQWVRQLVRALAGEGRTVFLFVVLAAAVALVSVTLSYLVTMAQLSQYDLVPALDDPGTWRVLGGSVYCLTAAALFSLGLGTLLRSTATTVTVALTVLLLPGILSFVTLDWVQTIVSYLPLPASSTLLTTGTTDVPGANLSTYTSLVVVAAYAVVPIVTAAVLLHRRDA